MMGLLEALLVLVGFAAIVVACAVGVWTWYEGRRVQPPDVPDPYREGLDATGRISAMAFEAAQALHHAAQRANREE
jgi:uncharacterized iron-regulated membrane protein